MNFEYFVLRTSCKSTSTSSSNSRGGLHSTVRTTYVSFKVCEYDMLVDLVDLTKIDYFRLLLKIQNTVSVYDVDLLIVRYCTCTRSTNLCLHDTTFSLPLTRNSIMILKS